MAATWWRVFVVLFPALWVVAAGKVSVQKCCGEDQLYVPYADKCKSSSEMISFSLPVVHDSPKNFNESFSITNGTLSSCSAGYVVNATADFRLFTNGSLQTINDMRYYEPSDYCLESAYQLDGRLSTFVRTCVADPCKSGTACVKKCCPRGHIYTLGGEHVNCMKLPTNFSETSLFGSEVRNEYTLREGVLPVCRQGRTLLDPSDSDRDKFSLKPETGDLHYCPTAKPVTLTDYCVDYIDELETIKAIVCFVGAPGDDDLGLQVYPYALFVTAFFTMATVVVYLLIPEMRNWHGKNVVCHIFSMTVTYVLLGVIQLSGSHLNNKPLCRATAVVLHFFFLASFTWLSVMSFSLSRALTNLKPPAASNILKEGRRRVRFIIYNIFAWGVPLLVVCLGQIMEVFATPCSEIVSPRFGDIKCWFADNEGLLYYLYVPVGCLIGTNIVLFVWTAFSYWKASQIGNRAVRGSRKAQRFRVIFGLFMLMGVNWLLELVSFFVGGNGNLWIFTDLLNIFTGVFIFFMFVCKRKVKELLLKRIRVYKKMLGFPQGDARFESSEQGPKKTQSADTLSTSASN